MTPHPIAKRRSTGTVARFGIVWGFGKDDTPGLAPVFLHFRNIRPRAGVVHRALCEGQKISYDLAITDRGLVAMDIAPIE